MKRGKILFGLSLIIILAVSINAMTGDSIIRSDKTPAIDKASNYELKKETTAQEIPEPIVNEEIVYEKPIVGVENHDCVDSDGENFLVSNVLRYDKEQYADYCEGTFAVDFTCPAERKSSGSFIGNVIRMIGNAIAEGEPIKHTKDCTLAGETYV